MDADEIISRLKAQSGETFQGGTARGIDLDKLYGKESNSSPASAAIDTRFVIEAQPSVSEPSIVPAPGRVITFQEQRPVVASANIELSGVPENGSASLLS